MVILMLAATALATVATTCLAIRIGNGPTTKRPPRAISARPLKTH